MTFKLVYMAYGRRGIRTVLEHFNTREDAEKVARVLGLRNYEIWGRVDEIHSA